MRTWPRFLLAGAANTLVTLILYWILLRVTGAQISYAISYVLGILLSYALGTRFVFRSKHTWTRFLAFPLVYVVCWSVGALVLQFAIPHVGERFAPIVSVIATVPLAFVLSRVVLTDGASIREG